MRAADKWESARFSSLFVALSFSSYPAESKAVDEAPPNTALELTPQAAPRSSPF